MCVLRVSAHAPVTQQDRTNTVSGVAQLNHIKLFQADVETKNQFVTILATQAGAQKAFDVSASRG